MLMLLLLLPPPPLCRCRCHYLDEPVVEDRAHALVDVRLPLHVRR
jgi:hypothetical protein